LVVTLAGGALLMSPRPSFAQTPLPDTITVLGYGAAYSEPDLAYISVGVDVSNEDVSVAINDANSRVEAVQAALSELGITAEDVRTENYYLYREQVYENGMPTDKFIFRVSFFLRITVRDLAQLPAAIATSVESGANAINNVSFGLQDTASVETEARALAVADARATAEELASLTGVTVGEVVAIQELSYPADPFAAQYANMGIGGGGGGGVTPPPVSAGALAVTTTVQVTFALSR
jgi:uncharacterized protein YggE